MVGDEILGVATPLAVALAEPVLGVGGRYYLNRSDAHIANREQFLEQLTVATFVSLAVVAFVGVAWVRPGGAPAEAAGLESAVLAALPFVGAPRRAGLPDPASTELNRAAAAHVRSPAQKISAAP